jgi:hypothetical protein
MCTCSDNELPDSGVTLFFTEAMYLRLHLIKYLPFIQHQLRLTEHSCSLTPLVVYSSETTKAKAQEVRQKQNF